MQLLSVFDQNHLQGMDDFNQLSVADFTTEDLDSNCLLPNVC